MSVYENHWLRILYVFYSSIRNRCTHSNVNTIFMHSPYVIFLIILKMKRNESGYIINFYDRVSCKHVRRQAIIRTNVDILLININQYLSHSHSEQNKYEQHSDMRSFIEIVFGDAIKISHWWISSKLTWTPASWKRGFALITVQIRHLKTLLIGQLWIEYHELQ